MLQSPSKVTTNSCAESLDISYHCCYHISVNKDRLLQTIRRNPRNTRFGDFCKAMEAVGFILDRQKGSHKVYEHHGTKETMVVQPRKDGHAKPYQVRQFVALVDLQHLEVIEP